MFAPLFFFFALILMVGCQSHDLVTPPMTDGDSVPGQRVRQVAPEYAGTAVYHTLYLPTDWQPGKAYPVIVEYTGNQSPKHGSTGEVKDANLGYGLTGGKGFIWVSMPYVQLGGLSTSIRWWGDRQATIDYCKTNLPRILAEFGGDPNNVVIVGFSRGAIACSYIGLADDEIASFWSGMFAHEHFDGQQEWGYPHDGRACALARLSRLDSRPVLVSGTHNAFVKGHQGLADFTFLPVPVDEIYDIPEGPVVHEHNDRWMHRDSVYRDRARAWLDEVIR